MKKTFNKLPRTVLINDIKISKKNKDFINKFLKYLDGYVTEVRMKKYKYALTRFAYLVEKDFDKLTKEEIREAGGIINKGELATKTKQDIITEIRTAFKFFFGENEYFPKVVSGLKAPTQKSKLRLPEEMPTEKQIYQMIKACGNSRDKFFIALLGLDGALRPIEARRIKWGEVKKDKYGHYIVIKTAKKSGDKETRVVRIIKSEPYFIKWNQDYPAERKDNNFVFINFSNLKPINDGTLASLFRRLKKKLNFKKLYPYMLRHCLITQMSKDPTISKSVLQKFVGHSLRSNTIAEYQHYGDDDLKDMQLAYNGILKNKIKTEVSRKPVKCPKCNKANEYDAEFCGFCNMALTQKRMVEGNDRMTILEKQMGEVVGLLKLKEQLTDGSARDRAELLVKDEKDVGFVEEVQKLKERYGGCTIV